jgi:hypothetical protein
MKQKVHEILEAFLPAIAQIQATDESDEQKKRNAKEWLRESVPSDDQAVNRYRVPTFDWNTFPGISRRTMS